MRRLLVACLVMLAVAACGGEPLGSAKTRVDGREVFVAQAPGCDDDQSCERTFYVDGTQYRPCADGAVEPTELAEMIAVGGDSTPDIREVRRLDDVPVDAAVAVLTTCGSVEGWFRGTAIGS